MIWRSCMSLRRSVSLDISETKMWVNKAAKSTGFALQLTSEYISQNSFGCSKKLHQFCFSQSISWLNFVYEASEFPFKCITFTLIGWCRIKDLINMRGSRPVKTLKINSRALKSIQHLTGNQMKGCWKRFFCIWVNISREGPQVIRD